MTQRYLNTIETLNEDKASRMIENQAEGNTKLIMTIPGISLIDSEIGDAGRFPDSYHLASYVGLSTHSSGGNTYHGGISRAAHT
ncbi:MAG: transposase [Conexivisphaerales archaeon]